MSSWFLYPLPLPSAGRLAYANEQFVGKAIRESGLAREDVWVTSKYDGHDDNVQGAVRTTLRKLGLAHLDLYLVHSPRVIVNDDLEGLWRRMVEIREAGLAKCVFYCLWPMDGEGLTSAYAGRSIGVSNFTLELLQRVVKIGKTLPAVNQVRRLDRAWRRMAESRPAQIRVHPYNYASCKEVLEFSAKHAIVTEAYGSLACVPFPPSTTPFHQDRIDIVGT